MAMVLLVAAQPQWTGFTDIYVGKLPLFALLIMIGELTKIDVVLQGVNERSELTPYTCLNSTSVADPIYGPCVKIRNIRRANVRLNSNLPVYICMPTHVYTYATIEHVHIPADLMTSSIS